MPFSLRVFALALTISLGAPALAQTPPATRTALTREVVLPSAQPSGEARNDRIPVTFYPARNADGSPMSEKAPGVLLLHPLGSNLKLVREFAGYLAKNGINAALPELPYHQRRALPGVSPIDKFAGGDARTVAQAFSQSASDALTTLDWLEQQSEVDTTRLGAVGLSLGAIVTHTIMGQDTRLKGAVAFLGGANLLDISRGTQLTRLFFKGRTIKDTPENRAILAPADPLTYAQNNQPRRVLMVQGARDDVVPSRTAQELWEAIGRPPIQWIDTNHFALILAQSGARKTTLAYLRNAWRGDFDASVPRVKAPTIKSGALVGLGPTVDAGVQYQAFSLGTTQHRALFSANLGMSTQGPFVGVAATVNSYIDVGIARRFSGDEFKPYASFHIVF